MSPLNTQKCKASTKLLTNPYTIKAQAYKVKIEGVKL
jgi:hypothetical protein